MPSAVKIHSAGLILFRQNAKSRPLFLLLFSRTSKYWGFPKGGLEEGENNLKAAIRETEEETGIKSFFIIAGFKTKYRYSYATDDALYKEEVVLRAAKTEIKKVKLSREHLKYRWVDYETAQKMIIYPNIKRALKQLNIFLKSRDAK